MANIKDFIKKIGNESVSLEEQQQALAQVEKTLVDAKAKREESIGKNVDLVISALKTIESKLEAKLAELNNTPAKQGVQGPTGKDGKDGQNGTDGRDGVSGKDGIDGKDGVDGQDGVSVIDAKIDFDGSLVVFLSNGNEIDCGQILSPDVAQNIIINSGGSGTSQSVTDTLASLQTQINTLTGIDGTLGTIAQQDANAVAITGGTINGTTVGATTPAAGTFTTITGQTEVLTGTGQNLVQYSEQIDNAYWSKSNVTVSANATTSPTGTTTADLIYPSSTGTNRVFFRGSVLTTGLTYTSSIYAKAGGLNFIYFAVETGAGVGAAWFNLSTGAVGTTIAGYTASISSAGSGWYRCSVTRTASSNFFIWGVSDADNSITATTSGTNGVYVWGAQLEVASSVGSYIQTVATAIYGTPTLSFSGVSEIGLLSNGALYLQPAGTGALQAQATTSSTVGGNARGSNAVDWQTSRPSGATRVASGNYATLSGGNNNIATAYASVSSGGESNGSNGIYSTVGGGSGNVANGERSAIVGGTLNTSAGFHNFIGGGFTNAGTANAAVTTQSGTMNATTAVTLSGSNANIKVGQYITGTSIAGDTYVAAISGTALTLSKNASGSSTSTLSFFTPHGVVVGGGNNQATGSYSFIGGGGDAGTAANRNRASADWSTVAGGWKNTASGIGSVIAGGGTYDGVNGSGNTASGATSFVGGGFSNTASNFGSMVIGGNGNTSSGNYSCVTGVNGSTRSINNSFVISSNAISTTGDSQTAILVLRTQTTNATATALTCDGAAATTNNQVIMPNNSAYFFTGEVVSGKTAGGDTKGWTIEGVIKRGANAASTALVGTPTVTSMYADVGAATWAIAVTADTTNGGIRVTFTGQASTTIRTVCQIRTTEMTY